MKVLGISGGFLGFSGDLWEFPEIFWGFMGISRGFWGFVVVISLKNDFQGIMIDRDASWGL